MATERLPDPPGDAVKVKLSNFIWQHRVEVQQPGTADGDWADAEQIIKTAGEQGAQKFIDRMSGNDPTVEESSEDD